MSQDVLKAVSLSMHYFTFCFAGGMLTLGILNLLLEKKRSIKYVIVYWFIKILVLNILGDVILVNFFGDIEWCHFVRIMIIVINIPLIYVVYCLVFKGGFTKIAVAGWISDILGGVLTSVTVFIVNFIEGKDDIFFANYICEFQPLDITCIIFVLFYLILFYRFLKSIFYKFRFYEFKHKKIIMAFFILYITTVSLSNLTEIANTFIGIVFAWVVTLSALVAIMIIYNENKYIGLSNYYLSLRQNLIFEQYSIMQKQIVQMKHNMELIDDQMTKINTITDNVSDEILQGYIDRLKEQYVFVSDRKYCSDIEIDAMLCYQYNMLKEDGVTARFDFSRYQYIGIEKNDIMILIIKICDRLKKKYARIQISDKEVGVVVAAVLNQIIIEVTISNKVKIRSIKKSLNDIIQKYNGTFLVDKSGKVIITLQGGTKND